MSDTPACAHLNVLYAPKDNADGTQSDAWACRDCLHPFWPQNLAVATHLAILRERNVGDSSKAARSEVVEKTGDGSESAGLRERLAFNDEEIYTLLSGRFGVSSITGNEDVAWLTGQLNKLLGLKDDSAPPSQAPSGLPQKKHSDYCPVKHKDAPAISRPSCGSEDATKQLGEKRARCIHGKEVL